MLRQKRNMQVPCARNITSKILKVLKNLTIDDKFVNKPVRLFIHQMMCREEKLLVRHNKVAK